MANNLYISEYAQNSTMTPTLVDEPALVNQKVDFTAGTTQSNAFRTDTKMVRLHSEVICSIKFGTNPTAAITDARMVAGQTEYFKISPGYKVAVIANT